MPERVRVELNQETVEAATGVVGYNAVDENLPHSMQDLYTRAHDDLKAALRSMEPVDTQIAANLQPQTGPQPVPANPMPMDEQYVREIALRLVVESSHKELELQTVDHRHLIDRAEAFAGFIKDGTTPNRTTH